ncbi:flagellar biosynthetic protein FliO [Teredinibacter haidensis]|uniref:flagellar biosynthetic protein FliO n=1 Tax=Teredinibacter haidensis TaxID=2731755 RepID=UPI0009F84420|nr:flagellar biosynthetic protein FliO [Teredinibacter haidensis]
MEINDRSTQIVSPSKKRTFACLVVVFFISLSATPFCWSLDEGIAAEAGAVAQAVKEPIADKEVMAPTRVLGQVAFGLLFVTILIFAMAWLTKRLGYGNFQAGAHMKVLANLPLSAREKAVLIDVEGTRLLLGVAPGRVNLIQKMETPPHYTGDAMQEDINKKNVQPLKKGQEFARYLKSILDQGSKS